MFTTIWSRRTANFTVSLAWEWEAEPDLSWDETGEVAEKLNTGEWGNYTFQVRVADSAGHTLAEDYLGNSIYADPAEFIDHRQCGRENRRLAAEGREGRCGSYFKDMVRSAVSEARREQNRPRAFLRAA